MVNVNLNNKTFTCPFCGHDQAFSNNCLAEDSVSEYFYEKNTAKYRGCRFKIYTLTCSNFDCNRNTVVAINFDKKYQIDLIPRVVCNTYPDYIPEQIRNDYIEANLILQNSPKAAATLLRRCLQGMIHDYWNIHEKNLNAEITELKNRIPLSQWNAIDGLRKVGNIGAHMEKDIGLIIDVDPEEAEALLKLIELLIEKWYIARHDEESLFEEITRISEKKESERKADASGNQTTN